MTTVNTRVPASDLRRLFDESGNETARECRDCRALLPSAVFSTHGGGRRRFVCRPCVLARLTARTASASRR